MTPIEELTLEIGTDAVVVCDHDRELLSLGKASTSVHCQSIRSPLLGALIGHHVAEGTINLDATLAELGIDDSVPPSLTSGERAARVRDLLSCRSGVYHPSNHQGRAARAVLPPRGTRRPGVFFLYNTWDFNALGTIFERAAGRSMFDEFAEMIAGPSGMRDYDPAEQHYAAQAWSEHRSYGFHISARDLARFGQLYLNGGRHGRHSVIPPGWVATSTRAHTVTGLGPAYGYLWWVERQGNLLTRTTVPAGSFAAYAAGGHCLLVMPAVDRVITLLADRARPGGTERAAHHPALTRLIHYATRSRISLTSGAGNPAYEQN
jgi:CubicO group peptidase (beta-lactamase class C family)